MGWNFKIKIENIFDQIFCIILLMSLIIEDCMLGNIFLLSFFQVHQQEVAIDYKLASDNFR